MKSRNRSQRRGRRRSMAIVSEPLAASGESRVTVTAAAISPIVKSRASGAHYSASGRFPFVIGIRRPWGGSMTEAGSTVRTCRAPPLGSHGGADRRVFGAVPDVAGGTGRRDGRSRSPIPVMSSWAAYTQRARLKAGKPCSSMAPPARAAASPSRSPGILGAEERSFATARNAEALKCGRGARGGCDDPLSRTARALDIASRSSSRPAWTS